NGNTFNAADTVAIAQIVPLTVVKTFADNSVDAGTGGHTFSIGVTNTGPFDAPSVQVSDAVDSRLHVTSVSNSATGEPCVASALQAVDSTYASLANGASVTITVTYSVAASVAPAASVSNTAYATANGNTFNGADTVAIARNVTLTVVKTFADNSVDAGTGGHTFSIVVTNTGPSDAASVHLTGAAAGRLHVTSVSNSATGEPCVASALQAVKSAEEGMATGAPAAITLPNR